MKDIELLLPRVLQYAAACPEPLAVRHIRDAAIQFCRRTRIWREQQDFVVKASNGSECLVPDRNTEIFEVTSATFYDGDDNKAKLEPKALDWLDLHQKGWRDWEGNPRYVTQTAPDTLKIAGPADGRLTVELILIPAEKAQSLPDPLVLVYSKEIAEGAAAEVLLTPGDFQNVDLAAVFAQRFQRSLDHWANLIPKGQQKAPRRTTARYL